MTPNEMAIAFYTMMRKECVRIVRIWSQTLLPPVVTTGLYFIVFGAFIGSQIAEIQGCSYMQFIVPGLIMMTVIINSYQNTISTLFFAKMIHNMDELLVSPTPKWLIILGFVSGGVVRGLLIAVLVLLVSMFFTQLAIYNLLVLLVTIVLTSVVFALGGLINGVFAKGFDGMSIVPTFVLTPLTYLGGVFYSIEQFPEVWQTVSLFNPILYMVNAFRYGFLGVSDVPLWASFGVLVGLCALFGGITLYLFNKNIGLRLG